MEEGPPRSRSLVYPLGVQSRPCAPTNHFDAEDFFMSAVRARSAQPVLLTSLADLSRTLDEAAQQSAPGAHASAAFAQWGASRDTPRPLRRRNLVDYWPMGF